MSAVSFPLGNNLSLESFKVEGVIKGGPEDHSTITALGLSCDGQFLAIGYESGLLKIRQTTDFKTVRIFNAGAKEGDVYSHIEVEGYVNALAINSDGSLLAVAFGSDLIVVEKPNSSQRRNHNVVQREENDRLDIVDIPLEVHFMDEHTIIAIYINRAVAYPTRLPFDEIFEISSGPHSWMGRSALSPDRRQLIAGNLVDGTDRYSLIKRRRVEFHEADNTTSRALRSCAYGISYLNERTVITGNNEPRITVIIDTGNIRDSGNHYRIEYIQLNKSLNATRIIVTGFIDDKPTIFAVNGEAGNCKVYVVSVAYLADQGTIQIPRMIVGRVPLIATVVLCGTLVLLAAAYLQARNTAEICAGVFRASESRMATTAGRKITDLE